ncbi:MAG: Ig-like domain-containing protein [Chloroflexia bacterium]
MDSTERDAGNSKLKTQNSKLKLLLGILLVLVVAGVGGAVWAGQAGWSTGTPRVLGIAPETGSRDVAGDAPISIAFNMPMNADSVRSALSIDPPTDGTTSWEGNTLIFHPQPGYRRGVTYTVQLGTGAASPLLQKIAASASTSFKTAGLPSLYRSVPPMGAAGVPTDTMVTLQFSRPMAALAALDGAKDPGSAVRIQPDPGGHWQWLGSTTLAYRTAGLRPATGYSVSVSHELSDYTGGQLDRDYSFSFTTLRPQVTATQPETNTQFVGTLDPIIVTFNSPVDRASAEAGFTLSPSAPGGFAWSPDGSVLTYTLTAPLPADTEIRAQISGVKPESGELAMEKPYGWTFRTTPHARVQETTPPDGASGVEQTNELIVRYTAPISNSAAEIAAGVRINPPVKGMSAYSYDQGATINIFAPLAPSTSYTVTVGGGPGYKDRDGTAVPAYTWHFRTARLKPDARVLNNNGLVSYYAGLPTRTFLSAVNVDQFVRLRLWKLTGDQMSGYLSAATQDRAQYTPSGDPLRIWDIPVAYHLDQIQTLNPIVALDAAADRLPPGFYYLRVTSPQTGNSPGTINGTALIVGNAGLIMKQGPHEVLLWAVDMGTGKPLVGRALRVFSGDKAFGAVTTDGDGLGRLDVAAPNGAPNLTAILDSGADAAVVSSNWDEDIGPWNFDLGIKGRVANAGLAVYTERPIYRPGQTVYFKGIVRNDDDGRYSVPTAPVEVSMSDDNGRPVYSATLTLSSFGSFAGQYTLPDAAPLGGYLLSCKCGSPDYNVGTSFEVQEYRKPEYLVNVSTDKQSYSNGEKIAVTAGADYFFGGGVAGAKMTVRVLGQDYFFEWTDPVSGGRYDFQDPEPINDLQTASQGEKRNETTLTTGPDGKATLDLPADVSKNPMSQLETIEASVQDNSNQTVSGNTQVIVHKAQWYAGLRPADYLGTVGSAVAVDVQTVSDSGERFPNAALGVKFYRRVWEQTTEKDEVGLDRPTWKPRDTQVGETTLTTDAQGKAQTQFTPSEAGEYRITAEGRDSLGNPVTSATYTYITDPSPNAGPVAWRQKNNSIVTLIADKASYNPGDTAHILVTSPFSQATGLLTIERGHILSHKIVDLSGPAPIIDLPIDDSYLPNAYLSLSMVAPPSGLNAMPGFRQGYIAIPVSAAKKQLSVAITPSSPAAHPGDTITYTLKVSDAAGAPVSAELSLALVDKAIFSLSGDTTPSLMDSFYGIRQLDFTTASSMLILADQVATAHISGGKGGGGGNGNGVVRTNFSDTAYWKAQVTTGADGRAVVSVRLPDNLTTWRLTALAVTADTLVGQATNEIVSSKPLLLRPRLPRFMVAGDRVEPAAIIENRSGCEADVDVTLVISGATFVKAGPAATQHVHLSTETVVSWAITASQAPTATFGFSVGAISCKGANLAGDAVEVALPVKPPLTAEDVATSGEVQGGDTATEHVFLPHGVDPTKGELTLEVAPSLAAGAAQAVQYVKENQYDSTEESVSRFLPLLQLDHAYATAGLKTPYSSEVPGIVNRSIVRLYADQHYDGGWGWFVEPSTDPYLTAYALEGLIAARTDGYPVSDQVTTNAAKYLADWLNSAPQDARAADLRLDTRAYVYFVLAENGRPDLSGARALAVRAPSLALYGRAYLALAFQRMGAPDDANRLLTDLAGAAKQTSTTAHWEEPAKNTPEYFLDMDTDARTTALIVRALIAHDKSDALIERGVRWLMENRRTGHWLSTQETATVLDTLADYMLASGELNGRSDWTATINGAAWGASAAGSGPTTSATDLRRSISELLINQDNTVSLVRQGSGGRLYYSMNLSYARPGEGVTARSEGLSVIREYLKLGTGGTSPASPMGSLAAGDLVEIHLTVIAPSDSYYVVAEDPLPAGLEAVNGTLQTTGLTERLNTPNPYNYGGEAGQVGKGGEGGKGSGGGTGAQAATASFFDHVDMRDDRTLLYATYLPAGVYEYRYLARATTPGTYTALPATARLTYLPDVWGRSDSAEFTVTAGK